MNNSSGDRSEQYYFVNSDTTSLHHHHHHHIPVSEAANYRIMQTPRDYSTNQAKMAEVLMSLPPLGLKLHKPTSFMNLIETRLFPDQTLTPNTPTDLNPKKASNADVFLLRIGTWQRVAKNKEGLVAKCYFSKRKLMWEILENGLKTKIQMHWEHISAISADIQQNLPGILQIELSQPPSFFRETEPQPRKHTLWDNASDFTGGQAMICRRHYLQFPPGELDKLYEKLLRYDPRFFEMSQMPFPSHHRSPYFDDTLGFGRDISFGCNGQQYTCTDFSPTSVMDISQPLEEPFNIEEMSMPDMAYWGQNVEDYYPDHHHHHHHRNINPMMDNESQFQRSYQGIDDQVEMNSSYTNYGGQESYCRFYPEYANEGKLLSYADYDPNQTMSRFLGDQNSVFPWM